MKNPSLPNITCPQSSTVVPGTEPAFFIRSLSLFKSVGSGAAAPTNDDRRDDTLNHGLIEDMQHFSANPEEVKCALLLI